VKEVLPQIGFLVVEDVNNIIGMKTVDGAGIIPEEDEDRIDATIDGPTREEDDLGDTEKREEEEQMEDRRTGGWRMRQGSCCLR
jgi:hypothetical protein